MFEKNGISLAAHGVLVAVLLMATIHLSYLFSALQGFIDWCNPYWIECVSISKTGRHGMAYILFKLGMIPAAFLLGIFWQRCSCWPERGSINPDPIVRQLGWVASIALFIYTIALGHTGDTMYLLRRFGVVLFLGLSFILQLRVILRIKQQGSYTVAKKLLIFSLLILTIALFSLFLDFWMEQVQEHLEDAFEWWLVLLLILHLGAMSIAFARIDS